MALRCVSLRLCLCLSVRLSLSFLSSYSELNLSKETSRTARCHDSSQSTTRGPPEFGVGLPVIHAGVRTLIGVWVSGTGTHAGSIFTGILKMGVQSVFLQGRTRAV